MILFVVVLYGWADLLSPSVNLEARGKIGSPDRISQSVNESMHRRKEDKKSIASSQLVLSKSFRPITV